MKNRNNSFQKSFLIGMLAVLPLLGNAQQINQDNFSSFDSATGITEYKLYTFSVKCIEGKAYATWTLIEPDENSFYLLERSSDNLNYEVVYVKKGTKSPNNIKLMHSFVDDKPFSGASFYRMKRITANGNTESEMVNINNVDLDNSTKGVVSLAK